MFNFKKGNKLITISVVLIFALLITACSNDSSGTTDSDESSGGNSETEVLKLGLSVPLSGSAASWGVTAEWVAKNAAEYINEQGGIEVEGQKYEFEVIAYDNKYNSTEGAQVAQSLINRDEVSFVVSTIGSAPTIALQSISEPAEVLHFTTAWSRDVKGKDYPYTVTTLNSPLEVVEPLYSYILGEHSDIKSVAIINPNDATGTETSDRTVEVVEEKGLNIASEEYYERDTTEFSQIITKIINENPDVVDLGATPPGDAGLILKALDEQGWDGVKVLTAGTSGQELVDAAGDASNDVYIGLAPDFEGEEATEVQKRLANDVKDEINENINAISIQPWDSIMALKAAIEHADSLESDDILQSLEEVEIESSYGLTYFGGEEIYGVPQQMLLPVTVTQIQDLKAVEVSRVIPTELEDKLN